MLPSPLHPAIVHFPIVFMILLPLVALGALWATRRETPNRRAWLVPVLAAAALWGSAWLAIQTGEKDEDRAEDLVGERTMEAHEEAAERFLVLSGGIVILMAAGLLRGRTGGLARTAATIAAFALVVPGYQVGHSGGRVAYGDGGTRGVAQVSGQEGPESRNPQQPDLQDDREQDEDD